MSLCSPLCLTHSSLVLIHVLHSIPLCHSYVLFSLLCIAFFSVLHLVSHFSMFFSCLTYLYHTFPTLHHISYSSLNTCILYHIYHCSPSCLTSLYHIILYNLHRVSCSSLFPNFAVSFLSKITLKFLIQGTLPCGTGLIIPVPEA
jgi:hypothetical protein